MVSINHNLRTRTTALNYYMKVVGPKFTSAR